MRLVRMVPESDDLNGTTIPRCEFCHKKDSFSYFAVTLTPCGSCGFYVIAENVRSAIVRVCDLLDGLHDTIEECKKHELEANERLNELREIQDLFAAEESRKNQLLP